MPQAAMLVRNLNRRQFRNMLDDSLRMVRRCWHLEQNGQPLTTFLTPHKYRAVLKILEVASSEQQSGNDEFSHFLRGFAATLYGLARLDEAIDLEQQLGPALGLSPMPPSETPGQPPADPPSDEPASHESFQLEHLIAFLQEEGLLWTVNEERGVVTVLLSETHHDPLHLVAWCDSVQSILFLSFRIPLVVPEKHRAAMADAIARANFGLPLGRFELHMDDGRFAFSTTMPTDEASLSPEQLRHTLYSSLVTVQQYLPAFKAVLFDGATPREAIHACEQLSESSGGDA